MKQKIQTLFILPNGDIAKRIDKYLYQSIGNMIIINNDVWNIKDQYDEIDCEDWLVRKIFLGKN
jgi:hypothetical protein